ncbi:MAG TPA: PhnD/SsuA/transferrin family substrate-binding protein [Burkholderiales bacterium]|nr:PhnD/SsuA/transferrin family substrate-binding protein [Burkholderiales bacterium]
MAVGCAALAQKAPPESARQDRIRLVVNEGAAGNADSTDILFRYERFSQMAGKALGGPVVIISARNRDRLQENLRNHAYELLLSRPNDVPARAVRDFGYVPVASAKEPYRTLFIVPKDSPLRTIADVKGKTIVTPDLYSNMWRAAKAMLRDNNIDMLKENVKSMRDQAAIGWSVENKMFDVGVVNSASGVARNWEKNGGRVVAASRNQINMPLIASPKLSAAQITKLRTAVLALDSTDSGRAILKEINLPGGFRETPREEFLEFLKWLGEETRPF